MFGPIPTPAGADSIVGGRLRERAVDQVEAAAGAEQQLAGLTTSPPDLNAVVQVGQWLLSGLSSSLGSLGSEQRPFFLRLIFSDGVVAGPRRIGTMGIAWSYCDAGMVDADAVVKYRIRDSNPCYRRERAASWTPRRMRHIVAGARSVSRASARVKAG